MGHVGDPARLRRLALGIFLCLVHASPPVAAQSEPEEPTVAELIARGKQSIDDLEFALGAEALMQAASDPRATQEERIEANLYAGIANRVMERDADARLNFEVVLTHAPNTELPPGLPPKITSFFELIRLQIKTAEEEAKASEEPERVGDAGAAPAGTSPDGTASALETGPEPEAMSPVVDDGSSLGTVLGLVGAGLAGLGGLGMLAGAGAAIGSELGLATPALGGNMKFALFFLGWGGVVVAVLGVLPLVGGSAFIVWGLLE